MPWVVAAVGALVFYFIAMLVASSGITKTFSAEVSLASLPGIRGMSAVFGVVTIFVWLYSFSIIFPEMRKMFSFEKRQQYVEVINKKCPAQQ
jgi:hypothetical protein